MSFMRGIRPCVSPSLFLTLSRSYSVRSSSALSSFAAPRGFEWRKLVSPHTSPDAIEAFKEIESSVSKLSADVAGTPPAPGAIDWAKWSKTIKTPGAVAELRKEYEATTVSIDAQERTSADKKPTEIVEFNSALDAIIAKAESIAKISEAEALKLKSVVKDLEAWNAEIADGIVPVSEYFQRFPGLKEQLMAEYENGEFVPTDAEKRWASLELSSLRAVLENGGELDAGGVVPADRFGDFKPTQIAEENKKWLQSVYGDLAKDEDTLEFEFDMDPYADEVDEHHH